MKTTTLGLKCMWGIRNAESNTHIHNLVMPTTSPIQPLNLDLWPHALWVVKSQFALHHSSKFLWSMSHTGRAPLCFSHTHAHTGPIQQPSSHLVWPPVPLWHCLWKHVHLVLPCLPPSLDGADYPHPESTSFTLFFSLSLSVHPLALSPLGEFSPPLHCVLLHLHIEKVVLTPQPSFYSREWNSSTLSKITPSSFHLYLIQLVFCSIDCPWSSTSFMLSVFLSGSLLG